MSVIDASIFICLISPQEEAHVATRRWFEASLRSGASLSAPVILLSEVGAAISRGQDDRQRARDALRTLQGSRLIRLHAISRPLA